MSASKCSVDGCGCAQFSPHAWLPKKCVDCKHPNTAHGVTATDNTPKQNAGAAAVDAKVQERADQKANEQKAKAKAEADLEPASGARTRQAAEALAQAQEDEARTARGGPQYFGQPTMASEAKCAQNHAESHIASASASHACLTLIDATFLVDFMMSRKPRSRLRNSAKHSDPRMVWTDVYVLCVIA